MREQRYSDMTSKKMVLVGTHAGEDPDRATIPFVMANAALASETDAVVILQSVGVMLAVKDQAKFIHAEGFPPLQDLMSSYMEMGGKILVCAPCLKARNITEADLIPGAKIIAAATVIAESTTADSTLVY